MKGKGITLDMPTHESSIVWNPGWESVHSEEGEDCEFLTYDGINRRKRLEVTTTEYSTIVSKCTNENHLFESGNKCEGNLLPW